MGKIYFQSGGKGGGGGVRGGTQSSPQNTYTGPISFRGWVPQFHRCLCSHLVYWSHVLSGGIPVTDWSRPLPGGCPTPGRGYSSPRWGYSSPQGVPQSQVGYSCPGVPPVRTGLGCLPRIGLGYPPPRTELYLPCGRRYASCIRAGDCLVLFKIMAICFGSRVIMMSVRNISKD